MALKKRLILTLYYNNGFYCLSRNFRLQQVGNVDWLLNAYPFKTVADSIDELFIINVSRETIEEYSNRFFLDVEKIMSKVFVPLTLGGGIRNFSHVNSLFENGSDKVVINRMIIENPLLVQQISKRYGCQSIVASIDFKKINNQYFSFLPQQKKTMILQDHINQVNKLNVGEIMLTSVDKDGTGQGYDTGVKEYIKECNSPIILSGGAGKPEHFLDALKIKEVSAVSTANLFNFLGDSLEISRNFLIDKGVNLRLLN